MGWLSKLWTTTPAITTPVEAPAESPERKPMKISDDLYFPKKTPSPGTVPAEMVFAAYKPAPGVIPGDGMAMDDALSTPPMAWAQQGFSAMAAEGLTFMGYPYLAELSQRSEYRIMTETIAKEMTRKWGGFKASSQDDNKQAQISKIEKEFRRLKVRDLFRTAEEKDGFFGRGHLFIDYGDDPDQPGTKELETSIGDGWDDASLAKVKNRRIKKLRLIEPIWTFPAEFGASDPLKDDWYEPQAWYVMGRRVHASRLLTFVAREVPDILKPAYAFGGLSLSQIAKPYVDNWLRTRQSVADLVRNFSTSVLKTNMADVLAGGSDASVLKRAALFAANRDNQGVMLLDNEVEDFVNVSTPLGSLDKLQAQAQEQQCSVSRIPLVKFTGISPSGLNASGDSELAVFGDEIHAQQEIVFGDNLHKLNGLIQLSLFGEVDPEIFFEFAPLEEMNEQELAELRKTQADTDIAYIDAGVLSPAESRARIAADPSSPYPGLDTTNAETNDDDFADAMRKVFAPTDDGSGASTDADAAFADGIKEALKP